ncbi:MAG: hypothetical protein ACJ76S_02835 [Solirubrobacteraceae bacterium]
MRERGRAKTVRRSIHPTPFGQDFCEVGLPLRTAELEAFRGAAPPSGEPRSGSDSDPGAGDQEPAGGD